MHLNVRQNINAMKQIISHLKFVWYALLVVLIATMFGLTLFNNKALSSVSIQLKEGQKEHQDKTIPLVSDPDEKLPDYKVSYLSEDGWQTIGTAVNRSAIDWIEFQISDPPNLALVQGIRIVDEDAVEDDLLEEVQLVDTVPDGVKFDYDIETRGSFKAGMAWFASTALGKAVFGAIFLAVFLVFISHIGI